MQPGYQPVAFASTYSDCGPGIIHRKARTIRSVVDCCYQDLKSTHKQVVLDAMFAKSFPILFSSQCLELT
jgi:hypothetical protein